VNILILGALARMIVISPGLSLAVLGVAIAIVVTLWMLLKK
jgi:hypothetical protein